MATLLLPAASPFLALGGAVAARSVHLALILAIPVAVLAVLRGRWLCRNVCPTGYLLDQAARLRPAARTRYRTFPSLGRWLVLATLGGAAFGWPVFLWMDPLSFFNAFFGGPVATGLEAVGLPVRRVLPWGMAAVAGALLPLVILLSAWRPHLWCQRLCPLGATQDLLGEAGRAVGRLRRRRVLAVRSPGMDRRSLLALLAGGAAGVVVTGAARTGASLLEPRSAPIRPPGSVLESRLSAVCARCGACLRACPEGIIHPALLEAGPLGLWTPVLRFGPSYCSEACHACNQVCPTGAIATTGLETKRRIALGFAVVYADLCLAFAEGRECMVCQEYCPFRAIEIETVDGRRGPVVSEALCRGCGLCQVVCPASPIAIVVEGRPQRILDPVDL